MQEKLHAPDGHVAFAFAGGVQQRPQEPQLDVEKRDVSQPSPGLPLQSPNPEAHTGPVAGTARRVSVYS